MVTRKLLHYFTDHEVMVVTSYPLADIIRNHDAEVWISKWALKLMDHDIKYIPRTAIKVSLVRLEPNWTSCPHLSPSHFNPTTNFEHLGSGIKSPTD
jgi:hypothetical protein